VFIFALQLYYVCSFASDVVAICVRSGSAVI